MIGFESAALTMVREALDNSLYVNIVFGDAAKRSSLVRSLGGARHGNMYGTRPASAPESAASQTWEATWVVEYGALPVLAYVKEAYAATVALALAAQAAGRLEAVLPSCSSGASLRTPRSAPASPARNPRGKCARQPSSRG